MSKLWSRGMSVLVAAVFALGLAGCGQESSESKSADTSEVANEYYLDLSDLGMNLTVYLRLDEEGSFLFSNTLDFETNKSSGTFQESDGAYIMVFDSVNGEEKTVSDGVTSSFTVLEDGSLDFSGCDYVYYGSAHIMTTSEDDPDIKLIGVIVPEDYDEPDTDSDFQAGNYVADDVTEGSVTYTHTISFYDDSTYMHVMCYEQDGQMCFAYETGEYGISTTQLALEPDGESRISSEVVDTETLNVSVYPYPDAEERETLVFKLAEEPALVAELSGTGEGSDGENFDVTVSVYSDGSYESTADGFTETGILAVSTANEYIKQYPDHPETGVRGLNQVTTVPAGTCTYEDGTLTLDGLRVRKSAGLSRYACTVVSD